MAENSATKLPIVRLIWIRGRGASFACGEARYYGWRWMFCVGPLTVCVWPCAEKDHTRQMPGAAL